MSYAEILGKVNRYYSGKLEAHGATARGVDWSSAESQQLRFAQLLKVRFDDRPYSINDYGCGYGALADYLTDQHHAFNYCGFDISAEMIATARELHSNMQNVSFVNEEHGLPRSDLSVASGIFNVKLQTSAMEWENYVLNTLETINGHAERGFAFNILTKYSDRELMRDDLYYADPLFFFDYCKTRFSRFVTLIHDYPLYEFTILVRKV